jgi:hypothetical protein
MACYIQLPQVGDEKAAQNRGPCQCGQKGVIETEVFKCNKLYAFATCPSTLRYVVDAPTIDVYCSKSRPIDNFEKVPKHFRTCLSPEMNFVEG